MPEVHLLQHVGTLCVIAELHVNVKILWAHAKMKLILMKLKLTKLNKIKFDLNKTYIYIFYDSRIVYNGQEIIKIIGNML